MRYRVVRAATGPLSGGKRDADNDGNRLDGARRDAICRTFVGPLRPAGDKYQVDINTQLRNFHIRLFVEQGGIVHATGKPAAVTYRRMHSVAIRSSDFANCNVNPPPTDAPTTSLSAPHSGVRPGPGIRYRRTRVVPNDERGPRRNEYGSRSVDARPIFRASRIPVCQQPAESPFYRASCRDRRTLAVSRSIPPRDLVTFDAT